jgi:hypothetical protein
MLMTVGVQFLLFGLLAEVMVRTYYESQDKKTYVIRNIHDPAKAEELPQITRRAA